MRLSQENARLALGIALLVPKAEQHVYARIHSERLVLRASSCTGLGIGATYYRELESFTGSPAGDRRVQ